MSKTKYWRNNSGDLHREDGPAIEYTDGANSWYINGKLHREDGPALDYSNGHKEWWLNGKLHRESEPAIEWADGDKCWYKNGLLHRENGPAVELKIGTKEWWINGKLHREDGPAREFSDGIKDYWLNGEQVKEEDLPMNQWPKMTIDEFENKIWKNEKGELHRLDGPAKECFNENKKWYKNGKLHRDDGPAIEYIDGSKEWRKNGERHRLDGPAYECTNGYKSWWINGKLHREDGAACEYADGTKEYFLNGKSVDEKDLPRRRESMLFFISSTGDFKEIENDCPAVCAEYGCYHYGIAKDFKKYTAVKIFKNGKWIDGQILNKKTCHLLLKVEGEDCELDLAKEVVGDLIASPKYSKYRFSLVSFVEVDGDK